MRAVIVAILLVAGCGGAQPSRWEPRRPLPGPETSCACDGAEREPRPSEASGPDDPRVVTAVCEGKVHDCHPVEGQGRLRMLD